MFCSRARVLVLAVLALAGCKKSWESSVVQPQLQLGATREARTSFPLVIATRDMEMPRFIHLFNTAYFVVISKDRMRFHVSLQHKWKSMSDPSRWIVWIEDDLGRRFYPEALDRKKIKPVSEVWGQIRYRDRYWTGQPDAPPDYTAALEEGQDGLPLGDATYYRGDGDYVFYRRDLFRKEMTRLTLVLKRPGYEYRYVWNFAGGEDALPVRGEVSANYR